MYHEIDFEVKKYSSRSLLRQMVISKFLEEEPGTADDYSNYRYNVEMLRDGRGIYLTRPAYKKKGFDFLIRVEGMVFQNGRDNPAHDDILNDLTEKKTENPAFTLKLYEAIKRIYDCEDPDDVLPVYAKVKFSVGYSIELILKVVKWFFIEQDIRDWNYSGRAMFMGGVDDALL